MRFQHCEVIRCAPEPGMVGTEFRAVLADGRGHVEMHGRITESQTGTAMAVLLEGER